MVDKTLTLIGLNIISACVTKGDGCDEEFNMCSSRCVLKRTFSKRGGKQMQKLRNAEPV